uniref:Uncharacterized protein n=1 Tax=Anguilla anguilla TaxID=7936 RepID=A0A0E9QQV6_ANGAN
MFIYTVNYGLLYPRKRKLLFVVNADEY